MGLSLVEALGQVDLEAAARFTAARLKEFAILVCSRPEVYPDGMAAYWPNRGPYITRSGSDPLAKPDDRVLPLRSLNTQDLVDLLKMPTCFGKSRARHPRPSRQLLPPALRQPLGVRALSRGARSRT